MSHVEFCWPYGSCFTALPHIARHPDSTFLKGPLFSIMRVSIISNKKIIYIQLYSKVYMNTFCAYSRTLIHNFFLPL